MTRDLADLADLKRWRADIRALAFAPKGKKKERQACVYRTAHELLRRDVGIRPTRRRP